MTFDKVLWSQETQTWNTPLSFFELLDEEFSFMTDPCTTEDNPLGCKKFFTPVTNGLDCKKWKGNAFLNPPYQRGILKLWVEEAIKYKRTSVVLLPARTGNTIWQDLIFDNAAMICFIRGRLRFSGHKNSAPFDSALAMFNEDGDFTQGQFTIFSQIGRAFTTGVYAS